MSEKIYVGSGKAHSEYPIVNISICLTDIKAQAEDFIFEYNNKKYIKLKVVEKKEPDKFGKTHYVEVDTWRPEQKEQEAEKDDLPF